MSENLFDRRILDAKSAKQLPALELAYVGDSVFSLFVKTSLIKKSARVHDLTVKANALVNAGNQENLFFRIESELNEEEREVALRGRNSNIRTKAKNFSIEEYRHATALEALIGFLFVTGRDSRLKFLFEKMNLFGENI